MTSPPAGADDDRALGAWLTARGLTGPEVTRTRLTGGLSNVTERVTDAEGRTVVLRRPPPTAREHGAHDVVREGAVLRALAASDVPVPRVLGVAADGDAVGAPFLVMEDVAGTVLRTAAEAGALGAAAGTAALDHAEVLGRLHRLDPAALDLPEGLRRRAAADGAAHVRRLLDRWGEQVPRARPEHRDALARALARLRDGVPPAVPSRLLHGDYRLDNVVVDPATGRVRAVLDWELATVGDPRTDLGSLMAVWSAPDDAFHPFPDGPSLAPGMPGRDDLVAAHAAAAGTRPSDLAYFTALALWKYACIVEGVHRRRAAGAPSDGPDPGDRTGPLARRALDLLG